MTVDAIDLAIKVLLRSAKLGLACVLLVLAGAAIGGIWDSPYTLWAWPGIPALLYLADSLFFK